MVKSDLNLISTSSKLTKRLVHKLATYSLVAASTLISLKTFADTPPSHDSKYPASWWAPVSKDGAPDWEILPQEAGPGEVILSKRNELGIFSNFAPTAFVYNGKKYASVEGLWQGTKYPENAEDPRFKLVGAVWPFTREQVFAMTAFEAKRAGDAASEIMKKFSVDWVSLDGERMIYRQQGESPFYKMIVEVMKAKLDQNPEVKRLLILTGDLVLMPDHKQVATDPKAWRYFEIWTALRKGILNPL